MAFRETYDFSLLQNEAERIIIAELERRLAELDPSEVCMCQDCVLDMAALALNTVKPVYRVSLLGTMYAHAMDEGSYHDEVRTAVANSIVRVRARPSHD
jgi:competence protein ComFB